MESVSHPAASTDPAQQALYKKYLPNGGGSIFTFTVKGNERTAKDFIDNLELFSLLANVADVKSLAIHPASTTHSEGTKEELLAQGIQEKCGLAPHVGRRSLLGVMQVFYDCLW